jgi:hypothetical protein
MISGSLRDPTGLFFSALKTRLLYFSAIRPIIQFQAATISALFKKGLSATFHGDRQPV